MRTTPARWLSLFVACVALTMVLDAILAEFGTRSIVFGAILGVAVASGDAASDSYRNRRARE
jgi:hypothetical protein